MLTPAFEIRQDDGFIYLTIKAPYTNVKNSDIYVHEDEFKFYSEPYFLRLNLPGHVLEGEQSTAKYDGDKGTFHIILEKEMHGEDFKDLDLLTKLLAPKLKPEQCLVEVVEEISEVDLDDEDGDIWQMKQEPYEEKEHALTGRHYGFNRSKTGVIGRLQEDLPSLCDIRDPEHKDIETARRERLKLEREKFDKFAFITDTLDEDHACQEVLELEMNYESEDIKFTDSQNEYLSKLPTKRYLMDKQQKLTCLLGLVDIMYAYAYTNRANDKEWNSESGWTVAKLSATLSHFEEFQSLRAVGVSCFRRSLIYPLYRSMKVASLCWKDTISIFEQGKKTVLQGLLTIQQAMKDDKECRLVLNDLYINDYCIWLQRQCRDERLREIADRMKLVSIESADLDLGLQELERIISRVQDIESEDSGSDSESSTSAQDSDDYHSEEEEVDSSDTSRTESPSSSQTSLASINRTL